MSAGIRAPLALLLAISFPISGTTEVVRPLALSQGVDVSSSASVAVDGEAVARALARVYPALVNLRVVSRTFGEGRAIRRPSVGSGVLVDREGHILTNYHVARDAVQIRCTLTNGEELDAEVVAHDPLTDLSVLRLKPKSAARSLPELQPAALAGDDELRVGDPVLAMGNPFALSSSVTLGIVSNSRRVFSDRAGTDLEEFEAEDGEAAGLLTQWIQHDALILPGNSGGPLVNLRGEVVGINQLGGRGMGFAIPVRVARTVLSGVLSPEGLRRGDLGLRIAPVAKLGRDSGGLVSWVRPGSASERAGVRAGDVLLELAGAPVAVRFVEQVPEFYQRVAALPVGKNVEVLLERSGVRQLLSVPVGALEVRVGLEGEVRELGISVREVTPSFALARNLPLEHGWWVTGVRPGQPAALGRPAVQVGDVLLAIDGRSVSEIGEFRAAPPRSGERWLLELQRGGERLLTVVRPTLKRAGRTGGELPKPWLGVRTQVVTEELAQALGQARAGGFRITEVLPWTEAERAGLQVGDLLVSFEGEALEARRQQDAAELQRLLEDRAIGEQVRLGLLRNNRPLEVTVSLEPRPLGTEEVGKLRQEDFEISVRELTFLDRAESLRDRNVEGVVVTEVTMGGWAHLAGLEVGDVVVLVEGQPTPTLERFEAVLTQIVAERREVVSFFVRRGKRTHYLFLEASWNDSGKEIVQ